MANQPSPGFEYVDSNAVDLNDYVDPLSATVVAGAVKDDDGRLIPQTFLVIDYADAGDTEDDPAKKIIFAIDPWVALKLGLSLSQGAITTSENFLASQTEVLKAVAEALAPAPRPAPSPYV